MPGIILQTKAFSKSFEKAFVFAENHWDKNTIRKGIKQLTNGITCVDNYLATAPSRFDKLSFLEIFA
ncbi:hypothetical protein [Nostoc sp. CHAB 5715]|uniref:hypothetical protein n=1 Tax=Nostoc sp. CHAB 5715 TaxID=2780400 RepID=UPI001E3D1379|nr:hypothetical protein [Nostoc sp. CHAB 5715]MCC5626117.1 hypothetical protein [Nostoc sp. CHAB 5715]